jgi:drug/metabolite transporter (DMT)-like permease
MWLLLVMRLGGGVRAQNGAGQPVMPAGRHAKWRRVLPWIILNGLAGQTLGVSAMQRAIETTRTGIVLAIIATTPIVVIPLSYFSEGERPSGRSLFGAVVAVAGVVGLTCLH